MDIGSSCKNLNKIAFPLIGFVGRITYPYGEFRPLVVPGNGYKSLRMEITFIVVDALSSYNAILRRTPLNPHKIIVSTCHPKDKIPDPSWNRVNKRGTNRLQGGIVLPPRGDEINLFIQTVGYPRKELCRPN